MSFASLGLDPVAVQSAKRRGYHRPTAVQQSCIPAVLKGRDVVALSKTGTGKTAAYLLPILSKLLTDDPSQSTSWMVVILVPTKELILQVSEAFESLLEWTDLDIGISAMGVKHPSDAALHTEHIAVCTPRQLNGLLRNPDGKQTCPLDRLLFLVVDEADLIMSYGYDADMKYIARQVPVSCQCILMSATKSPELDSVVKLVMQHPETIDLLGKNRSQQSTIGHYYLHCSEEERGVYLLSLLRFKIVRQPVMVFVDDVKEGYRLKLFLECFKISNGLLHRALPQTTRQSLISDFNGGRHSVFLVVDDRSMQRDFGSRQTKKKHDRQSEDRSPKEVEFGVARGLDFKNVQTIINYDLPQTVNGYLHRVGRTGRAGRRGVALSFFSSQDDTLRQEIVQYLEENDDGIEMHLFPFLSPEQVSSLKYRASDVMRSINRRSIDAARRRDIKTELLKSKELTKYFDEHPIEKSLLESIEGQHPKRKFQNIDALPSYIAPPEETTRIDEERKKKRRTKKIDPLTIKRVSKRKPRK